MNLQFQKKKSLEGTITIQVEKADYAELLAEKIRSFSKKMRIKGFRPGHIPPSLIKKMYGASIVFDSVSALLNDSLSRYIQESELCIVGEPLPDLELMQQVDWENQQTFNFQYDIGWVSAFHVELNKDLQVTAYQVNQVSDQTIDQIISSFRKTYGERQLVNQSDIDDVLVGIWEHKQLAIPQKIYLPVVKSEEKIAKTLVGLQVNEVIQLDMKDAIAQGIYPIGLDDQKLQNLLDLESLGEFRVEKIERTVLADLNQAFFLKVLGKQAIVPSLEDFREKLHQYVLHNKQQEADRLLEDSIKTKLLAIVAINLPDEFLKRWLKYKNAKLTDRNLERYYKQYTQELQWGLLLEKIVQEYELSVITDEVIEETKIRLKAAYQMPEDNLDWVVQKFLQENQGDNYKKIYKAVLFSKAFSCIKEKITLRSQNISVEEFNQLETYQPA